MIVFFLGANPVIGAEKAPDFTLTDIDGAEFSLSDYRGKVVLLNFFATWCSDCVAEIPRLKSLGDEFGDDLTIISVSVSLSSDTVEKLQQFRQNHGIDWVVARDTVGVNDEYSVPYVPTVVIIDQEGYIQHQHSGLTDESVLREEINEIMSATLFTISILSPENKTYPAKDISLTFTLSESASWIGYSLNGQNNVTVNGNTTIVDLSDGAHTIKVYANDTAGNVGRSDTIHFTVDTLAPHIEILSPENKSYTTSSVPLDFSVNETTPWIGYSLNGKTNITIAGNTTLIGLSEGMHSLIVYAGDIVGNIGSSDMIHFVIQTSQTDTTPPSISVVSPRNKTYARIDIPLTFAIDESVSWMAYSVDGMTNVTTPENTTLSGLLDGSHILIVYAKDVAGNIGASEIVYFFIETQRPEPEPESFLPWIVVFTAILTVGGATFVVYFRRASMPDTHKLKHLYEENAENSAGTPKRRRTIFVSLMVLSIAIVAIAGFWYLQQSRSSGTLAPDFSLTDLNGDAFRLSDFEGRVVIIDFMATWCGGCKEQLPHLKVIWENEDYINEIVVISIDVDPFESEEAIRAFRPEYATWTWARDTLKANVAQSYQVSLIPKTIIIDQNGYIRFQHEGIVDSSTFIQKIDELLGDISTAHLALKLNL